MKVPTYQRQEKAAVVRQPKASGTSPEYTALRNVGIAAENLGVALQQRQERTDLANATNGMNALLEEDILFRAGLEEKRGAEAVEITTEYKDWWNDAVKKHKKTYTFNPRSETLFDGMTKDHYLSKVGSLASHQAKQKRVFNQSVLARNLQNIIADSMADPFAMLDDNVLAVEEAIVAYHVKALGLLGGEYTTAAANDVEAKIKTAVLSGMVVKNPIAADKWIDKWETDIGPEASAGFKQKSKDEIINQTIDAAYNIARGMDDIGKAEDYINGLPIPMQKRRSLIKNIHSDYDREQAQTKEAQEEIVKQNNLDVIEAHYNNTLKEDDLDMLASGQQVSESIFKWLKKEISEGEKVKENNPEVVGEIAARIELRSFKEALPMLEGALRQGQILTETYISSVKAMAAKMYSDAVGYINKAMQPSELEVSFFKKQKHADAVSDLATRVASGENPMEAAKDIVKLNRTTQAGSLYRYRNPRYLKGEKDNVVNLAEAEYETVEAYKREELTDGEYKAEMELIENIKKAIAESENSKITDEEIDKTIKALKVGK